MIYLFSSRDPLIVYMNVIVVEGDRVLISWKGAEPITIYPGRVKIAKL